MRTLFALFVSALLLFANNGMFQSVPENEAQLLQSGPSKAYCPNCGMYLPKFYKTNHAVKLKNGEVRQYCSVHCLVEEREMGYLRDKRDQISEILVVDVTGKQFIDARKAHYVIGSRVKGTMSGTSKYAFAKKADAEAFMIENGGTLSDYDGAYKTSLADFEKDMQMIKQNRGNMMYKMGEQMYNANCDKKAFEQFHAHTMGELKAEIRDSKACGEGLSDPQLQGIMLYYWDIKLDRFGKH